MDLTWESPQQAWLLDRQADGRNEGEGWKRMGVGRKGGVWKHRTGEDAASSPPSCPATLGKRHFSTPAQMLLHCLELQPNGEQALISYCLPLTVDPCDKCSSRCYTATPKKSTSDGSKKNRSILNNRGCEHIAVPEGSSVDNLCSPHMSERRAVQGSELARSAKQVYDGKTRAVKGEFSYVETVVVILCSLAYFPRPPGRERSPAVGGHRHRGSLTCLDQPYRCSAGLSIS
ncbi:hypothetical protein QQF64_031954 [Cirrhinus molitorella]|uniref:Uncharacterized protein n=1 Tax=Cirrhinus molitorella TaxID=172907 RepID=A0ABR3MYL5_9TELE